MSSTLLAVAWLAPDRVLSARSALQPPMARFAFASCVPFGNSAPTNSLIPERSGLLFRASALEPAPDALLKEIEALLKLDGAQVVRYADRKRGQRRAALLQRTATDTTLKGLLLPVDTRAQSRKRRCCKMNWSRPMAALCYCPAPSRRCSSCRAASRCAPASM